MDEMLFAACRYVWSYLSRIPDHIAAAIEWCCKALWFCIEWCCKALWFCIECVFHILVSGGEIAIEIIGAILGALAEVLGGLFD